MIITPVPCLFLLIAGHALCDYALQGDFMAKAKNHRQPIPGVPWYQPLTAHAVIQAVPVFLLTGSLYLAAWELVLHWLIDYAKCDGKFGYNTDQALHLLCKLSWWGTWVLLWWPGRVRL